MLESGDRNPRSAQKITFDLERLGEEGFGMKSKVDLVLRLAKRTCRFVTF